MANNDSLTPLVPQNRRPLAPAMASNHFQGRKTQSRYCFASIEDFDKIEEKGGETAWGLRAAKFLYTKVWHAINLLSMLKDVMNESSEGVASLMRADGDEICALRNVVESAKILLDDCAKVAGHLDSLMCDGSADGTTQLTDCDLFTEICRARSQLALLSILSGHVGSLGMKAGADDMLRHRLCDAIERIESLLYDCVEDAGQVGDHLSELAGLASIDRRPSTRLEMQS